MSEVWKSYTYSSQMRLLGKTPYIYNITEGKAQYFVGVCLPVESSVTFLFGVYCDWDQIEGHTKASNESHKHSLQHKLEINSLRQSHFKALLSYFFDTYLYYLSFVRSPLYLFQVWLINFFHKLIQNVKPWIILTCRWHISNHFGLQPIIDCSTERACSISQYNCSVTLYSVSPMGPHHTHGYTIWK